LQHLPERQSASAVPQALFADNGPRTKRRTNENTGPGGIGSREGWGQQLLAVWLCHI